MGGDAPRSGLQDRAPAPDLHRRHRARVRPDQRALGIARGCFTTARAEHGRPWWPERHAQRLARDARVLGLGTVDVARVVELLHELAAPSRGGDALRIRVEAHAEPAGPRLRGVAAALGADPPWWFVMRPSRAIHPGPTPTSTAKCIERECWDGALAEAHRFGADEVLLYDAHGFLVEGGRSNFVVSRRDGALVTPPLARGAQAGVARALLLERCPALVEADVRPLDVIGARELVAVNAVRGVRAIWLGAGPRPNGTDAYGPVASRLARALSDG